MKPRKLYKGTQVAEELNVSPSYISAVKKAMGITSRWLDIEAISQWIHDHPHFRSHHVWGERAEKAFGAMPASPLAEISGKSDGSPMTHG